MATTKKDPAAISLGKRGGKGRLKTMTQEERSRSARHAALVRHHGRKILRKPDVYWIVLDPTADNPPVILFADEDKQKVRAWARANRPDAFITTLERRVLDRRTSLGGIHREYEPNIQRQVTALQTLAEATKEGGK